MQNPMIAFVGVGFDCEVFNYDRRNWDLYRGNQLYLHKQARPRLDKAQVLDDWSWLPDGFVCRYLPDGVNLSEESQAIVSSYIIQSFHKGLTRAVEIKGVQWGFGLSEWAINNDVPIYTDDMKVLVI